LFLLLFFWITESGEVYSCGYGQQVKKKKWIKIIKIIIEIYYLQFFIFLFVQGQLGHNNGANEKLPKKIQSLSLNSIVVVQVSAGWRHSICLSMDQQVYTWGHGDKVKI
jgi:alpha-tubulin suppressor-like RCC1 family protein